VKVNYGLLTENKPQLRPVAPGRVFAAAAVYRTLGLTTSVTDSQVWHTDSELLLGLIIAHNFYKNGFPESETQGRGPLVDYRRLTSLLKRLGFWVGGQGGAGELTGQVQPDLNKASSGESAVLEQAQKVVSAGNQAMLRAAQRKAWIQVYVKVGPSTVPEKEVSYAHALSSLCDSSTPKVVYLGTYEIEKVEYRSVEIQDLQQHMKYQEGLPEESEFKFPSVDGDFKRYCRFRTQMHLRFHLKPVEHALDDAGP
jgi:hypothetical protein